MNESRLSRPASLLRSRILGIVGSSVLVASACGGSSSSSSNAGGSPGTGGIATGGTSTGGTSSGGAAGIGGTGGADGSSDAPTKTCLTQAELDAFCAVPPDGGYVPWSCWGEGGKYAPDAGVWVADAGTACPDSILPNNGADCSSYTSPELQNSQCCYLYNPGGAGCGRPFLVDGQARRAAAVERSDWLGDCESGGLDLDAATTSALAKAWLEDARLEHASIASFARFTLDLLALGAPPELLRDAQLASCDEVVHARLCFGLASRYAGRHLGPGPLATEGSVTTVSLAEAAARAAREGCVGETLAALIANEQLEGAKDESVVAALSRIAEDEARHAELAWRFVTWAVETGGDPVRRAVRRAFDGALAELRRAAPVGEPNADLATLRAHGRLGAGQQRASELTLLAEVIEPCVARLLATAPAAAAHVGQEQSVSA